MHLKYDINCLNNNNKQQVRNSPYFQHGKYKHKWSPKIQTNLDSIQSSILFERHLPNQHFVCCICFRSIDCNPQIYKCNNLHLFKYHLILLRFRRGPNTIACFYHKKMKSRNYCFVRRVHFVYKDVHWIHKTTIAKTQASCTRMCTILVGFKWLQNTKRACKDLWTDTLDVQSGHAKGTLTVCAYWTPIDLNHLAWACSFY